MADKIPDLPRHIIEYIFELAKLDIDTRLALKIKPKPINIDENLYEKLKHMFDIRSKCWFRYGKDFPDSDAYCLGWATGKEQEIALNTCRNYDIYFYNFGDGVRIHLELNESYYSNTERIVTNIYRTCYFVNTGEQCDLFTDIYFDSDISDSDSD